MGQGTPPTGIGKRFLKLCRRTIPGRTTHGVASGFREIEFYQWEKDRQPVLILCVNVTDESHIKGRTSNEGFRCPGLNEYLTGLLKREYERRKNRQP